LTYALGRFVGLPRSTRITRLHRYYELIRPCAPRRYSHPRSSRSLGFSLLIGAPGSHVPPGSLNQDRAVYLPATAQPVSRSPLDFFTDPKSNLLSMAVVSISTAHQRFTRVRLPGPHLTESCPAFSRSVHHLGSHPHAAPGGLRTGPATRPRGAHPHLPCSMASVSRSVRPPFSAFVAHSWEGQAL